MDRSLLARRVAPVAVFAAVLGGLVLAGTRHHTGGAAHLSPIPLGAATGARNASGRDAAAPAIAPYGGGKVVVPDALLAGLPDSGPVYRVSVPGDTDRIAALASALGVVGEVRTDEQGWVVGTGERVLRVMKTYGTSWYLGPDKVAVDGGSTSSDGSTGSGGSGVASAEPASVAPAPPVATASDTPVAVAVPPPCPTPEPDAKTVCGGPYPLAPPVSPPPAPSEGTARTVAAPVLAALGLGDATVTVEDGWGAKDVVARPVVGGLAAYGFETRISVDAAAEIRWASGFLGSAALKDTYPLLDPRAAVERGGAGGIEPMILAPLPPCVSGQPCPTPTPAPDRVATAVRLALQFAPGFDATDAGYLTPAWVLTFADSAYPMPVQALPDAYITTPPPGVPDGGVLDGGVGVETAVPPNAP